MDELILIKFGILWILWKSVDYNFRSGRTVWIEKSFRNVLFVYTDQDERHYRINYKMINIATSLCNFIRLGHFVFPIFPWSLTAHIISFPYFFSWRAWMLACHSYHNSFCWTCLLIVQCFYCIFFGPEKFFYKDQCSVIGRCCNFMKIRLHPDWSYMYTDSWLIAVDSKQCSMPCTVFENSDTIVFELHEN